MIIRVLGSAAGGGFPQINCNCDNCCSVRARRPGFRPRGQTCVGVSRDGRAWTLLGASPDLRQQVAATPALWPDRAAGRRSSPIGSVVLTDGEVDCVAGLLSLREGFTFDLLAPRAVLDALAADPIFDVLTAACVRRVPLLPGQPYSAPSGLRLTAFAVPGKVPRYAGTGLRGEVESGNATIGLEVRDPATGASFFHVPCCAAVDGTLAERLRGARLVLFDGTLYGDDELIAQGLSEKSGRRMGHISMSGPQGAIAALGGLGISRRVFVHINNSNPVLDEGSAERRAVEQAGWEIAFDGMEFQL
jgi:pyrroloquinoline quinone biosynthesis protein B